MDWKMNWKAYFSERDLGQGFCLGLQGFAKRSISDNKVLV